MSAECQIGGGSERKQPAKPRGRVKHIAVHPRDIRNAPEDVGIPERDGVMLLEILRSKVPKSPTRQIVVRPVDDLPRKHRPPEGQRRGDEDREGEEPSVARLEGCFSSSGGSLRRHGGRPP